MSNPAVYLLVETKIKENIIRIEDNLGEGIHIHIGNIRISVTIDDFEAIYESVKYAAKYLFEQKGFKWKYVDESALDWDWLSNYGRINSINITTKKIGDLYTKKPVDASCTKQIIVPISKSVFVEYLQSHRKEIDAYVEPSLFGIDSKQRLNDIEKIICKQGYPYDDKYILINSYGQIYDGDHRAAVLYNLYGDSYELPVIEMKFEESEISILKQMKLSKRKYFFSKICDKLKWWIKFPFRGIKRIKSQVNNLLKKKNDNGTEQIIFKDRKQIFDFLKLNGKPYFFIPISTVNNGVLVSGTFVVDTPKENKMLTGNCYKILYSDYKGLYTTNKPIMLECNEEKYVICDCLYCKSFFEKSILPLDKYCIKYAWEKTIKNENGYVFSSPEIVLLYLLCNCIFEKKKFEKNDIDFIINHMEIIVSSEFIFLLRKEFFLYTEYLVDELCNKKFDEIVDKYRMFKEY